MTNATNIRVLYGALRHIARHSIWYWDYTHILTLASSRAQQNNDSYSGRGDLLLCNAALGFPPDRALLGLHYIQLLGFQYTHNVSCERVKD